MKRLLALLAILLISQVGYGQQKMDQLFNAFRGESDVTSVNIGNITMKLASLFTETMGVNGIEILEFDNCAPGVPLIFPVTISIVPVYCKVLPPARLPICMEVSLNSPLMFES